MRLLLDPSATRSRCFDLDLGFHNRHVVGPIVGDLWWKLHSNLGTIIKPRA
jgi:hypothetical protein